MLGIIEVAVLTLLGFSEVVLAKSSVHQAAHIRAHVLAARKVMTNTSAPIIPVNVWKAMKLVEDAQSTVAAQNSFRIENPLKNNYIISGSAGVQSINRLSAIEPLDNQTLSAARIVGEWDAIHNPLPPLDLGDLVFGSISKRDSGNFWMETIPHTGTVPFGAAGYKVSLETNNHSYVTHTVS